MDYQSLPEYVKQMRKRYGLTQLELSEKAGVGLRFVRELEQGKVSLRMDKVNQVLQLFGAKLAPFRMNQNESDA
jgi:y4mF family transcriptional regulator